MPFILVNICNCQYSGCLCCPVLALHILWHVSAVCTQPYSLWCCNVQNISQSYGTPYTGLLEWVHAWPCYAYISGTQCLFSLIFDLGLGSTGNVILVPDSILIENCESVGQRYSHSMHLGISKYTLYWGYLHTSSETVTSFIWDVHMLLCVLVVGNTIIGSKWLNFKVIPCGPGSKKNYAFYVGFFQYSNHELFWATHTVCK